ncbi:MAG TPA: ABC transporter permease [Bacteroidota bacterium]|jgi:peptide/nickel transport system permease protein|nr:ABC transporter permease [Bacteroidota bacterium]
MLGLIIKRTTTALVLLFGLVTIMFLILHLSPGDPVSAMISPTLPSAVAERLRLEFGLDQTLPVQYGRWLKNALAGDFGVSFGHQRPVGEVIADVLPNTVILATTAILLEIILGITFGMFAARHQDSLLDRIVTNAGLAIYTLPAFWIGFLLLAVFSYQLGIFPSSQMHSIGMESAPPLSRFLDFARHLVLPAVTIAIPGTAAVARFFRTHLTSVQQEEYVTFARSLGISNKKVFLFYELPNAISPVITVLGLEIGTLLAGAVVTETMFAWPGMGRLVVVAIFSRDYPLVMGCTLVSGVIIILGNLLADGLHSIVDPRVRLAR